MKRVTLKLRYLTLALLTLAFLGGCDSTVEPGNHAAGVVFLRADQTEAARFVYQGAITGELTVPVAGSASYRVRVITATGEIEDIDGVEHSLDDVRVILPTRVAVSLQGDDEVVLNGLDAGATTLRVFLKHGAHTEFEIRDVPLRVLAP